MCTQNASGRKEGGKEGSQQTVVGIRGPVGDGISTKIARNFARRIPRVRVNGSTSNYPLRPYVTRFETFAVLARCSR